MTDLYAVMDQLIAANAFAVMAVCEALGVSRSAYSAWCEETTTTRERRDEQLRPLMRDIFWEHKRRYGARRIAFELGQRGEACGGERAAKLLDAEGLKAIQPNSFQPKTTDSRHTLGFSPNLIQDTSDPSRLNELWVADITSVPLADGGFVYLALIMDRCSRKIVGWELAKSMTEELTLATLRSAINQRQPSTGLIHHRDRGGQYAGKQYRVVLRRADIHQSMSHADPPRRTTTTPSWNLALEPSRPTTRISNLRGENSRPTSPTTTTPADTRPSSISPPLNSN